LADVSNATRDRRSGCDALIKPKEIHALGLDVDAACALTK